MQAVSALHTAKVAVNVPKQQVIWMDDLPVGVVADGVLHFIEPDHLGTPRSVIDAASDTPVWHWALAGEAFGDSAPDQDPDKDGTAFVFDMRFAGQRFDAASEHNYNYFRDYDSGVGRYLQSDPTGLIGGMGTYAYAYGDPVSLFDPLGLQSIGPTGAYVGPPITEPMLRLPDYFKVAVGYFVATGSLTWSRNGKLYGSYGLRRPYPQPLNAGISLNAGYLACATPSSLKQDSFHTGTGISTISAYRALGGGIAWSPGAGTAIEFGVGAGASLQGLDPKTELGGDIGHEIYDTGLGW